MSGHLRDGQHLGGDQLLGLLYGGGEDAHLKSCRDCSARMLAMKERRAELAAPVEVSHEFLASQRRKIAARLDGRARLTWKWVPAAVAVCALAIAVVIGHPTQAPTSTAQVDGGDEQLFSEVYSMDQSTEARAAAPIHGLFEENQ